MKLVLLDSMAFVWGIKKKASPGQEHMIEITERFLDWLDENNSIVLVPTPIITEIVAPITDNQDVENLMSTLYKRYRIAALDDISARIAGEIWASKNGFLEYCKRNGEVGLRNKYKYDILLLGMAKSNKVDMIYSHDGGLRDLAKANGLRAKDIPIIPPKAVQKSIVFPESQKKKSPKEASELFHGIMKASVKGNPKPKKASGKKKK